MAMFVRGQKSSEIVVGVLNDLHNLKKPAGVKYSRKNDILPFEDPASLEFFSSKSDAPLFLFGNHNKKRPHNIVMGRMFDAHVLDMIELGVASYTPMQEFKDTVKPNVGAKPMILLRGSAFETSTAVQVLGNLVVDFFRGRVVDSINLAGLEHVIVLQADDGEALVHFRVYRLVLKKSGTKLPRVELEEMGPRIDWQIRRTQFADKDLRKKAMEIPAEAVKHAPKNVSWNEMGDKMGRVHMHKQNFEGFQTRKMKGLKKHLTPKPGDEKNEPAQSSTE